VIIWRVEKETGWMIYENPGMVGKVELQGKGTPESPCEFAWSITYATGSGQPIFSGVEKNLPTACHKVEYHFEPKNIVDKIAYMMRNVAAENFLSDKELIVLDRKMKSIEGHIEVEDYMEVDKINCRHNQEDFCDCICHHPYKGIIIHDRACCNPCMGCGFREKV
jgi:hypothetical protein